MTAPKPLGPIIHSFFIDHLVTVKGLRPASVRSYRDTIRLLLCFVAEDKGSKITKLTVDDLSFERVLGFLRHLEDDRGNHVRTRNQRLAILHTLFEYIASREPEMLGVCQRVAAIPSKRAAPAETHFLERDEMEALFRGLPRTGRLALRDRALLSSSTTPGRGCRRSQTCEPDNLSLARSPSSVFTGRATSGERARCGTRPQSFWSSCSRRQARRRRRTCQCSCPQPANRSLVSASTRSCGATPGTSMTCAPTAASARTSSATQPPSTCSSPVLK